VLGRNARQKRGGKGEKGGTWEEKDWEDPLRNGSGRRFSEAKRHGKKEKRGWGRTFPSKNGGVGSFETKRQNGNDARDTSPKEKGRNLEGPEQPQRGNVEIIGAATPDRER